MLTATEIVIKLGENFTLGPVTLEIQLGSILVILGENGSGKTTLLRALLGEHKLNSGNINYGGSKWEGFAPNERAKLCSLVPQFEPIPFSFTVLETVLMARLPWGKGLWEKEADLTAATSALEKLNLEHLAHQSLDSLSGGERQRVLIARSLAQQSQILLLDEPTAHVDMKSRAELAQILQLLKQECKAVVVTTHDLEWGTRIADEVILLDRGKVAATSIDPETFSQVLGVRIQVAQTESGRAFARPDFNN